MQWLWKRRWQARTSPRCASSCRGIPPRFEAGAHSGLVERQAEDALQLLFVGARPPAHDAAVAGRSQHLVTEFRRRLRLECLGPGLADHDPTAQLLAERSPLVDRVLGEELVDRPGVARLPRSPVSVKPLGQARKHGPTLRQATAPTDSRDACSAISQFAAREFAAARSSPSMRSAIRTVSWSPARSATRLSSSYAAISRCSNA